MHRIRWSVLGLAAAALIGVLPTPAQEAADAGQPGGPHPDGPPKVLTFYYPWYGNPDARGGSGRWSHWSGVDAENQKIATSTNYPVLGAYDSHAPDVIARHCAWTNEAGIDGFIVSWWGHGAFSDQAMPAVLDGCQKAGIDVTIYYETVPGPKTPESAARDLLKLLRRYAGHPAWLRVGGKPVVFIYGRAVGELGIDGWGKAIAQVNREHEGGAVFFGDSFRPQAAEVFDGLHTYNTAGALRGKSAEETAAWAKETYPKWVKTAKQAGRISTITVIPGYDDKKIRKPGLRVERYDGALYRRQWEAAISADPDWVLVTSFNEWHEGSEIEPSTELGDQYLKLTAEYAARFKGGR